MTINSLNNECIAVKFYNIKSIQENDKVTGEFNDSGGSKAFNDTNAQSFRIYVPYKGDELESTARKLCQ